MIDKFYKIYIDNEHHVIEMKIAGTFPEEIADAFHQDYLQKIRPLDTKDFILKIDCRNMNLISKEMLPKLQISLALYKKSNFKVIKFLIIKNRDIKQQLLRVLGNGGIKNFEFIEFE